MISSDNRLVFRILKMTPRHIRNGFCGSDTDLGLAEEMWSMRLLSTLPNYSFYLINFLFPISWFNFLYLDCDQLISNFIYFDFIHIFITDYVVSTVKKNCETINCTARWCQKFINLLNLLTKNLNLEISRSLSHFIVYQQALEITYIALPSTNFSTS